MRYSASEKFEIIELAERRHSQPARHWLQSGPRSTFYDWYGRYQEGGIEAGGWQVETAADLEQDL